jgi:RND family efflux transporter MFP subunit
MNRLFFNIPAVLLLALLLNACGNEVAGDAEETTNKRAVLVSVQQVEMTDLPVWLKSVGRVHSLSAPTLAAEVSGRVTSISAYAGETIEAGQVLAEIDTTTLLLQQQAAAAVIERLNVHIANGQRRVDRLQTLSAKNLSSQTQLDDAREQLEAFRAEYKAAQAQLALVNDSLAKSRITAPVSGVIQTRLINEGDFVRYGQPLFEITRPDQLQAWLAFPETSAMQIQIGQVAEIRSPLAPDEFVEGEITDLQPAIGKGSRAVMSIIDLKSPGKLRPEGTISGRVLITTIKSAVMVPSISVVRRPAGDVVYVINGGKAQARQVTTGHHQKDFVEISSGLQGNEIVATDGAAFLTDGADIKIAETVE